MTSESTTYGVSCHFNQRHDYHLSMLLPLEFHNGTCSDSSSAGVLASPTVHVAVAEPSPGPHRLLGHAHTRGNQTYILAKAPTSASVGSTQISAAHPGKSPSPFTHQLRIPGHLSCK